MPGFSVYLLNVLCILLLDTVFIFLFSFERCPEDYSCLLKFIKISFSIFGQWTWCILFETLFLVFSSGYPLSICQEIRLLVSHPDSISFIFYSFRIWGIRYLHFLISVKFGVLTIHNPLSYTPDNDNSLYIQCYISLYISTEV